MRIACVQADVVFGDPAANSQRALAELERLHRQGVHLAVFPEAFLTGYCVSTPEAARRISIPVRADDGHKVTEAPESVTSLHRRCTELGIHAIVGFAGIEDGRIYNGAVLIVPGGPMYRYIKTHLPDLGLDKFVRRGDSLPVFETELGKIGVLICFDQRQPEAARTLALKGAELIVLPTNWPQGAENSANIMTIARAAENRVFYAACNRVGTENGFTFIGCSKIIAPSGKVLACAGDGEETIVADIDLAEARNKRAVVRPGEYEWTVFESRRPELYGELVKE
ncbi:MAG: carbon-nitrogen hydrolase family protein [Armatimonadetes bacterium]|nr:carbon-nitrogen hydrolase family protein [Armatimonadota bacterium]